MKKREAYRTDGQWAGPEDDAKIFGSAYDAIKANQNDCFPRGAIAGEVGSG